jgi:glycosyltransferase involved in cell wall biosynthesis
MRNVTSNRLVVACIPYFHCPLHVARAVESLLAQTYKNLWVVVINDADPNPPWRSLSHIRDPRLVRYSLPQNRGPYFAMATVLNATAAPYFLVQDADDWSSPDRVQYLVTALERDRSDFAVSAQPQYVDTAGKRKVVEVRWTRSSASGNEREPFVLQTALTPQWDHRAPHHGLFRTSLLRELGGYYGGLRVGYDVLLTNLVLMAGRISHVPRPLYWRLLRSDSLTHAKSTGLGSEYANRTGVEIRRIYKACYAWYAQFLGQRISRDDLKRAIRVLCNSGLSETDRQALLHESKRLSYLLTPRHFSVRSPAASAPQFLS